MNLAVATMNMTEFRQHIIDAGKNSVVCMVKSAAQSMPGRFVCTTVDWILKLVEKSAEFSLPQEETITTEENGKSALCSKPTIRPTNWPIFLMTLATLRVFRLVWDMSAILIGCEPLHPGRIVRAMQSARRGLAALLTEEETNTRGERGERDPRGDANFNTNKRSLIQSIHLKFASLSCFDSSRSSPSPPATRMRVSANHEMAFLPAPVPDEKSTADLNSTPQRTHDSMEEVQDDESPSRETDLDESAETPTRALIDRYSAEDSEDDPSFDPDKCQAESSSEDEEQEGESLSPEELQALKEELTQTKELLELMKAQSHMFLEDQRNSGTSPTKPIDIRPGNDSEEQRGYHSSSEYKCSDDADADFYSPVSSKSSSPERDIPPETVTNDEHGQKPKKSNGHGVTEPAQLSTSPKATNKVLYHKSKRMNHGNRKKK